MQQAQRLARKLRSGASKEIDRIKQWDKTTSRFALILLLLGLLLAMPLLAYIFAEPSMRSRWYYPLLPLTLCLWSTHALTF